jgi:hypothetical protein
MDGSWCCEISTNTGQCGFFSTQVGFIVVPKYKAQFRHILTFVEYIMGCGMYKELPTVLYCVSQQFCIVFPMAVSWRGAHPIQSSQSTSLPQGNDVYLHIYTHFGIVMF